MAWIFLSISIGLLILSLRWNLKRSRLHSTFDLPRKNLLLTYSPLSFIPGKQSIFYFLNYWNSIPSLFDRLGFTVTNPSLAWRNSKHRCQALQNFLKLSQQRGTKVHLLYDESAAAEVHEVLNNTQESLADSVASCTCIVSCQKTQSKTSYELRPARVPVMEIVVPKAAQSPFFWNLHQWLTGNRRTSSSAIGLSSNQNILIEQLMIRIQTLAEIETLHQGPHHERQYQI